MRVLIVVTHLLGVGHLTRAAAIARAFARAGHSVTLASGGMPARIEPCDRLRLLQLPPVRIVGTDFRTLLDEDGNSVDAERLRARGAALRDAIAAERPDVVITELFPFGRRILADEFMATIEAARALSPRPLILASVRDILVAPEKAGRVDEAHERVAALYDGVLVHGDPALVPLEASWPVDERIRSLLYYTGFVGDDRLVPPPPPSGEILVSGGGSAASLPLLDAATGAARLVLGHSWRILAGAGVPQDAFEQLRAQAPENAIVERARLDFPALLAACAVSVSQAGYNTVLDVLGAGCRAVFVPFEGGRETEQRLRADRLAQGGAARVIGETELDAPRLAEAVARALADPRPQGPPIARDGAARTVAIAEGLRRAPALPATARTYVHHALDDALDQLSGSGRPIAMWIRDDDAVAHTPALDRLLAMTRSVAAPLGLAAVPALAEPSLAERLAAADGVSVLVHGFCHRNHAPPGAKKAEFGDHRPVDAMVTEAGDALTICRHRFGPLALPVFVPPWNRISPDLADRLAGAGFTGLSTFRNRAAPRTTGGLTQVNTHLDPIDWHGTRGLAEPDRLVADLAGMITARLTGASDPAEPIGLLVHHLVHDEQIWHLLAWLLDRLRKTRKIDWPDATILFQ
jgi:predicted glycosyltransferase